MVNNLNNLCLKSTFQDITSIQNVNNTLAALLNRVFNSNVKVNITYNETDTITSPSRLAFTHDYGWSINSSGDTVFNAIVTLNNKILPNSGQELTAITILHEGLHGYFEKLGLFVDDPTNQHLLMATKYVDLLRQSVKSVYPSISDAGANSLIMGEMADISRLSPTTFRKLDSTYAITPQMVADTITAYKNGTKGTKCH